MAGQILKKISELLLPVKRYNISGYIRGFKITEGEGGRGREEVREKNNPFRDLSPHTHNQVSIRGMTFVG